MAKHYDEKELKYIQSLGRFDDNLSLFLARELQYVRRKALETKKLPLSSFAVFPVSTEIPPGAATAVQKEYDSVGMAKIISNYADDLPRCDVMARETVVKVRSLGDSYGYNYEEIQASQFAGQSLDARKAAAARRGIDSKLNKIAWQGDAEHGIVGFLNHANITSYSLPNDGDNSSTKWEDKNANQIIRDFNAILRTITTQTNGLEEANTVLMPPAIYDLLAATPKSQYTDRTIMAFLKEAHPEINRWMKVPELTAAGASNKDVFMAGAFDEEHIAFEIPVRFEQLPIEKRNLEYVVDCVAKTVGVTVLYPLAFCKAVGV